MNQQQLSAKDVEHVGEKLYEIIEGEIKVAEKKLEKGPLDLAYIAYIQNLENLMIQAVREAKIR